MMCSVSEGGTDSEYITLRRDFDFKDRTGINHGEDTKECPLKDVLRGLN